MGIVVKSSRASSSWQHVTADVDINDVNMWEKEMVMDIARKAFTENARFGQPTLAPKVIGEHWVTVGKSRTRRMETATLPRVP